MLKRVSQVCSTSYSMKKQIKIILSGFNIETEDVFEEDLVEVEKLRNLSESF